jgi:hypothetical protein
MTNPFGSQAAGSLFGGTTSAAAPMFGAATSTPAFTGFGSMAPTSTTTTMFGAPVASTATTAPMFSGFGAQTVAPSATPFSFSGTSTAPTLFGATAPTTTSSIFNPQPFAGFGAQQPVAAPTATQPFSFSSPFGSTAAPTTGFGAPINISQTQIQQQNIPQPIPFNQQRFLAASLLDPFASRGKKDFSNIDQIKPPTDLIVVSTSSTTLTTVTSYHVIRKYNRKNQHR